MWKMVLVVLLASNVFASRIARNEINSFKPKVVSDSMVKRYFNKLLPTTVINTIYTTPYPDMYALVVGSGIVYGNLKSSYLVVGHMFNVYTQDDLTARLQRDSLPKVDLSKIDVSDTVKVQATGKVNKKLIIFIDPDCPYCRQLEQEVVKNQLSKKADIYYMLMPLSIHPNAKNHATKILCSVNPAKTLDDYMLKQESEPKVEMIKDCNADPVFERVGSVARTLGINGTPTIITGNGEMIMGNDINAIEEYLNK